MLSSFIRVAACTRWVCCQMTLLKIIIKITHFKTKPAVGYLFSFLNMMLTLKKNLASMGKTIFGKDRLKAEFSLLQLRLS